MTIRARSPSCIQIEHYSASASTIASIVFEIRQTTHTSILSLKNATRALRALEGFQK